MSALNQDNDRLRKALNAATVPKAAAASGDARHPALPLGSLAPLQQDDGDGDASAARGRVGPDLRRELAAAAEVERLRGLMADAAATSATREAELHAELEAQVRGFDDEDERSRAACRAGDTGAETTRLRPPRII